MFGGVAHVEKKIVNRGTLFDRDIFHFCIGAGDFEDLFVLSILSFVFVLVFSDVFFN